MFIQHVQNTSLSDSDDWSGAYSIGFECTGLPHNSTFGCAEFPELVAMLKKLIFGNKMCILILHFVFPILTKYFYCVIWQYAAFIYMYIYILANHNKCHLKAF